MPSTERKDTKRSSAPHSSRIVRRAFSMQETDAQLIELLRVRYATQGLLMNQSEVVRIGLRVLADMNDGDLKKQAESLKRLAVTSRTKKPKA